MNQPDSEQLQKEIERLKAENDFLRVKAAASLLRTSDTALWEVASHLPIGIVLENKDTLVMNFYVEGLTGYTNYELSTIPLWFDTLFGERSKEEYERYLLAREAGFPTAYEVTFTSKTGQVRVVEFRGRIFSDNEAWSLVDVTERNEAQQALAASEARHQAVLNALPDVLFMLDNNGNFIDYHAPDEMLLFAPPQDFMGKPIYDLLPEWLVREGEYWCRRAVETKEPQIWEYHYGEYDWEARAVLYHEDSVLVMIREVTTRKEAERKLLDSENRYRTLIDLLPDGFYMAKEVEILFANPTLARMLGYNSPEEIIGKSLYDILHPDFHTLVKKRKQELDSGMSPIAQREHYLHHDGSTVPVDAVGVRIDLNGEKVGLVVLRDMTEQIEAQERFRQGQNLFLTFMDTFPALVWIKDEEGRYVYGNQRWQNRLEAPEWLGKTARDIYVPYIAEETIASDQITLQQDEPTHNILRDETHPEIKIWDVQKFRLKGRGEGYSLGGFAIDITERIHLEEQLRQALKLESIGRLAGGVAHDFNNLLTVIIGYADMIADSLVPTDTYYTGIQQILQAANRAAGLTHQLLAFARKQMIEPKEIDPHALIQHLVPLLERLIGEHIPISIKLAPHVGSITVDPGQLEQVLINLSVNARDAMPNGGRMVIETQKEYLGEEVTRHITDLQPDNYVRISLTDTGTGIPPEVLENIFEPFFTTKDIGKGTGLGLATCHGIIKQAGGHISVYSEVGQGTTFHIYLRQTSERVDAGASEPKASQLPMGKGHILLVEDEDMIRTMAKAVLERQGYLVHAYENGLEALMGIESLQEPIDLVVTDVVMPQMNGRELAERLLALHGDTLKILYVSGYTESEIVHHGVLEEGLEFLPKPFTPAALIQRVRTLMGE